MLVTKMTTSIKSSKYVALSFKNSSEDKILAALTSDMNVIIWEWDKPRATQAVDTALRAFTEINIMFFYPGDDSLVLIGENVHKNHLMK
jgi:hypothetical protein